MVSLETITEIFNQIWYTNKEYNLHTKCQSRKTIESKLAQMSEDEKKEAMGDLLNNGLMTKSEAQSWMELNKKYNQVKDKDLSKFPEHIQEEIEGIKEALYHIESRIITQKSPYPNVDLSKFKEAEETDSKDIITNIEQKGIDNQNKKLDGTDWDLYGDGADFYGFDGYWGMNKSLVMGEDKYLNSLIKDGTIPKEDFNYYQNRIHNQINHLNYLMDNSGGLPQDTVLYRGGKFPPNLIPGMKGKFPCFSSTSYNKSVADSFQVEGKEYMIKIYAPKGTRGLHGGGNMYNSNNSHIGSPNEHEFTLGAGQKYIVLDRNDKERTVEILLY